MSVAKSGVVLILILIIIESGFLYVVVTSTMNNTKNTSKSGLVNLYFFNTQYLYPFDNETYKEIWNTTRSLYEISQFLKLGNYSVLITWEGYRQGGLGYSEWFVVASTLQPDKNGLIHQAILRLYLFNFSLVASYQNTLKYNPTPVENGTKAILDYISNPEIIPPPLDQEFHENYPFLILLENPSDFGGVVIFNEETGKIMIVATSVWNGAGSLIYPEYLPDLGDLSFP